MNPNRPAQLNRAILGILGLLLLIVGALVVLAGTGVLATVLPIRADGPLLPADLSFPGWVPWAGAVLAIVIGLLALRWLIAQTMRRPTTSEWQLAPDVHAGATYIDSDTATAPLAEEIAEYPGVHAATAHLTGPRQHPYLYVRVSADDQADISDLRHRIDNDAIPRLTQSLDLPALGADVLLRLDATSGGRAR
jgi:hypothetical protein